MNKKRYIDELNHIAAGEAFKRETRRLMLAARPAAPAGQGPPPAKWPVRRYARHIATAAACLLLVAALSVAAVNLGPFFTEPSVSGGILAQEAALAYGNASEDGASPPYAASSNATARTDAVSGAPPTTSATLDDQTNATYGKLSLLPFGPLPTGGMGFEGYLLNDFATFGANSVWTPEDGAPQTMPVYQNRAQKDQYLMLPEGMGYGEAEMTALGLWAASGAGVTVESFETNILRTTLPPPDGGTQGREAEVLYNLEGSFDGGGIEVYPDGMIRVFWEPYKADTPLKAPVGDAPREEHLAFVQSIINTCPGLFGTMQAPAPDANKDHFFSGDAHWTYYVYDAAGGAAGQILNRSVGVATLAVNEDGYFYNAWLSRRDLSGHLGDYPVIGPDEALAQVAAGKGLTTAPGGFPGANNVAAVDLVYYTDPQIGVFMPYYKIYALLEGEAAALPEESPDAMNTYGAWYYPAVVPEYLEILPEAEMHFR